MTHPYQYAILLGSSFILGACSTTTPQSHLPVVPENAPISRAPAISKPVLTPLAPVAVEQAPIVRNAQVYGGLSVAAASVGYAPNYPVNYQVRTFSDAIGAQDVIEITVYKVPELSKTVQVESSGNITLPLIGSVPARGLSPSRLEQAIAQRLEQEFMNNPQVSVLVKQSAQNRVTVEGSVKTPGVFPVSNDLSLLQAVAMAGGTAQAEVPHTVMLHRRSQGGMIQQRIDLDAIRSGMAPDVPLQQDDRVVVLEAPMNQRVTVEGEVSSPGMFPIKGRMTILQALALAGGGTKLANTEEAILMRYLPNGQTERYKVDLTAIRMGQAPDPELAADDRLVVLPSERKQFIENAKGFISPLKLF